MTNVSGSGLSMHRDSHGTLVTELGKQTIERAQQLAQGGAVTESDVENFTSALIGCRGSQQISLHHIVYIAEVARYLAIAVYDHLLATQQGAYPPWNYGGVRALGVLPRTE